MIQQDRWYIVTANINYNVLARIFDDEQRKTICELINRGYIPHHTSVGIGKTGKRHWSLTEYSGRFGCGYKMTTTSEYSNNFNHLTYFLKQAV